MPFPFGSKKHSTKHHSPELPLNGHQVNKNLTQFNDAKNCFESISNINGPGHLDIHQQQQNNVATNEFVLQTNCLVFKCQLADGSSTVFVSDFSNMKQLYEKIADAFKKKGIHLNTSEILYCTLNTPKVDMDTLLGGQIGLDDFIFCHRKGRPKEIEMNKSEEYLGLIITDNGNGYSFIKKVKPGSLADQINFIEAGDQIEKVNNQSMIGCRHFEVAKFLKDIPIGSTFTIRLIEPLKDAYSNIGPNSSKKQVPLSSGSAFGTGKETLRLRAKGVATVEQAPSQAIQIAITKINSLLESFVGINDSELSNQIWDLGKDCINPHDFITAIDSSDLNEFEFSDDFIFDLWGAISDAKQGRLT